MEHELIRNPVTGETLRVLESGDDVFRVEVTIKPRGEIAADHLHPAQEQTIFVLEGKLGLRLGNNEQILGPGAVRVIPAGLAHYQWNAHDGVTRAVEQFRPAGRAHDMFRVAFAMASDGHTNSKGVPKPFIGAAFVSEFRDVVRPTSIWLRLLFGLLGPLSRMFGYHRVIRDYIDRFRTAEIQRARVMTVKDVSIAVEAIGRGATIAEEGM